jgi:hypothetical protein
MLIPTYPLREASGFAPGFSAILQICKKQRFTLLIKEHINRKSKYNRRVARVLFALLTKQKTLKILLYLFVL